MLKLAGRAVFRSGDFKVVPLPGTNVLAFTRTAGNQRALVATNFSNDWQRVVIPLPQEWRNRIQRGRTYTLDDLYFDSKPAVEQDRPGVSPRYTFTGDELLDNGIYVDLAPWDSHVFSNLKAENKFEKLGKIIFGTDIKTPSPAGAWHVGDAVRLLGWTGRFTFYWTTFGTVLLPRVLNWFQDKLMDSWLPFIFIKIPRSLGNLVPTDLLKMAYGLIFYRYAIIVGYYVMPVIYSAVFFGHRRPFNVSAPEEVKMSLLHKRAIKHLVAFQSNDQRRAVFDMVKRVEPTAEWVESSEDYLVVQLTRGVKLRVVIALSHVPSHIKRPDLHALATTAEMPIPFNVATGRTYIVTLQTALLRYPENALYTVLEHEIEEALIHTQEGIDFGGAHARVAEMQGPEAVERVAEAIRQDNEKTAETDAKKPALITLEGASGTGKSTTAKALSQQMGAAYLSMGQIYRTLTWLARRENIDLAAPEAQEKLAALGQTLHYETVDGELHLFAGDVDTVTIDSEIRAREVESTVPRVAELVRETVVAPMVSRLLSTLLVRGMPVVLEGREEIRAIQPPEGRVFNLRLVAPPEVRAERRLGDWLKKASLGELFMKFFPGVTLPSEPEMRARLLNLVQEDLTTRDEADLRQVSDTLKKMGVTMIDTARLDISQAVRAITDLVSGKLPLAGTWSVRSAELLAKEVLPALRDGTLAVTSAGLSMLPQIWDRLEGALVDRETAWKAYADKVSGLPYEVQAQILHEVASAQEHRQSFSQDQQTRVVELLEAVTGVAAVTIDSFDPTTQTLALTIAPQTGQPFALRVFLSDVPSFRKYPEMHVMGTIRGPTATDNAYEISLQQLITKMPAESAVQETIVFHEIREVVLIQSGMNPEAAHQKTLSEQGESAVERVTLALRKEAVKLDPAVQSLRVRANELRTEQPAPVKIDIPELALPLPVSQERYLEDMPVRMRLGQPAGLIDLVNLSEFFAGPETARLIDARGIAAQLDLRGLPFADAEERRSLVEKLIALQESAESSVLEGVTRTAESLPEGRPKAREAVSDLIVEAVIAAGREEGQLAAQKNANVVSAYRASLQTRFEKLLNDLLAIGATTGLRAEDEVVAALAAVYEKAFLQGAQRFEYLADEQVLAPKEGETASKLDVGMFDVVGSLNDPQNADTVAKIVTKAGLYRSDLGKFAAAIMTDGLTATADEVRRDVLARLARSGFSKEECDKISANLLIVPTLNAVVGGKIDLDIMFNTVQEHFKGRIGQISLFTSNPARFREPWRAQIAWVLYLVMPHGVLQASKSIEEGLRAVRVLNTQA
ncbi:MAG TPA: (d)CMP kinase [Elusimicrobiota bacterium]|nr:(d)CMP kinase [Elusimicrobiota bacterium]